MLNNIVANAIEAIETKGFIKIEVTTTPNVITFTIENRWPMYS